jgi:type VI protein secretion system component VasK
VTWATAFILIGYLAGTAWQRIEHYTNVASYALFGAALVLVIGIVLWNRHRQHEKDVETEAEMAAESDSEPAAELQSEAESLQSEAEPESESARTRRS